MNGKHAIVEGGDRSGASLFKSLQVKDGDTTRIYHLFDDCLIQADTDDPKTDSKPPFIAKIVAIGTGGPKKKVTMCPSYCDYMNISEHPPCQPCAAFAVTASLLATSAAT